MKDPTLVDVIADLFERGDTLDAEDVDFGDAANNNVTIPIIGGLSGAVTYYGAALTKTPFARITWSWSAPLMYDEDGNIISPTDPDILDDMYLDPVVDYMYAVGNTGTITPTSFRSTNGATSVVTEGHPLGLNVKIVVYAVTKSGIKGPTSEYTATVSKDTTPPGAPSAGTLTTAAGTVSVIYDGLVNGGSAQPDDYMYTEVYAGTSNPPTTKVGQTNGRGIVTFAATPGTTVYVRMASLDTSYNISGYSTVLSIVVKSILDDTDLSTQLANKASIYAQNTDPGSVVDGSWWYKTNAAIPSQIDNIYKRVSGAWVQDTINAAAVISALSIVAGQLSANSVVSDNIASDSILARHIKVGEVSADKISSGVLSAIVTISGILRTSDTGKRVVIDSTGITLYDALDNPITFINTNGESFFNGSVTATSLEVVGNMQLNSATNRMIPGSVLTLSSQIQQPPTAPSVTNYWDSLVLKDSSGNTIGANFGVSRMSDGKFIVNMGASYIVTNADGTYNSTIASSYSSTECVVSGNYVYSRLGNLYSPTFSLLRTNLSTGGQATYTSADGNWPVGVLNSEGAYTFPFKLGQSDTTNEILISKYVSSTWVRIWTINNLTGDNFSATFSASKTGGTTVCPFYKGAADFGGSTYLFKPGYAVGYVYSVSLYSTNLIDTDKSFNLANSGTVANGMGYHGSTLWVSQGSTVYFYDGITWTGNTSKDHDFAYTYYDTVGTVSESKKSPTTTFYLYRRAKAKISVQGWSPDTSTVDSVNELRFYAAVAGGSLRPQGNNSVGYINLSTIATAGSAPPASSTFPALTPATIKNDDGSLIISADGVVTQKQVRSRMYKDTVGHNSGGGTYAANTWVQVSGLTVDGAYGITTDASSGTFTTTITDFYDILFKGRWGNYGSVYNRALAIVKGTSAPATDASNVIEIVSIEQSGWLIQQVSALSVQLTNGDVISFWIRAGVSSTFNGSNTALPGWTSMTINKR